MNWWRQGKKPSNHVQGQSNIIVQFWNNVFFTGTDKYFSQVSVFHSIVSLYRSKRIHLLPTRPCYGGHRLFFPKEFQGRNIHEMDILVIMMEDIQVVHPFPGHPHGAFLA